MTFACRLYRATGFNANNIPDDPVLLDDSHISHTDTAALDIFQSRALGSIRVRCTWHQARNVDYIRLYDSTENEYWYYSASNPRMLASDVCEFDVLPDYISSWGGVANLKILDGITERVHVDNDAFGRYSVDDPLLIPNEPLQIETEWVTTETPYNDGYVTVIESTVDPIDTLADLDSAVYTDVNHPNDVAPVPQIKKVSNKTFFYIGHAPNVLATSEGTALYIVTTNGTVPTGVSPASNIEEAIANLRSLGVEQCIVNQFQYPVSMVSLTGSNVVLGRIANISKKEATLHATNIASVISTTQDAVKNKLVAYSPVTKVGILTAAGNGAEFSIEDITSGGVANTDVKMFSDPRPDGKPYFRFESVNQDSSFDGFWRNCVAGMQWKQVPLIFQGASGSSINTQKLQNSMAIEDLQRGAQHANYVAGMVSGSVNMLAGAVQNIASGVSAGGTAGLVSGIAGGVGSMISGGANLVNMATQEGYNKKIFAQNRKSELYDLEVANKVVAPTVNFPYNSEIVRDSLGNGCLVYVYKYSTNDRDRIDKLLTMYGYKVAKPLEKSDFTNRRYFNFVACNNVSIGGHATWVNEGMAEQLKAGVRVWHVLPDPSYYTNNPIRPNT